MITGSHVVLFSADPQADRAFFADALGLSHVDAGGGWLIFALPPAEVAMHPADGEPRHELYLTCDDLDATMQALREKGVRFSQEVTEERWGRVTRLRLPGGSDLGLYEPRHPRANEG